MIREIVINGRSVSYNLERKDVKNINLRIKSDQKIFVSANKKVCVSEIEKFINTKADYILKALDYYAEIEKYAPKPKLYIDGESFRLLGHDRRLKVVKGKKNMVECDEAYLTLTVKDVDDYELLSVSGYMPYDTTIESTEIDILNLESEIIEKFPDSFLIGNYDIKLISNETEYIAKD